ncbi:MAG: glycosyltransferase family 4 protein [Conexivisphaerales archaeon]
MPKVDGSVRCVYDHTRKLAGRGHTVVLVTRGVHNNDRLYEKMERVNIIRTRLAFRSTSSIKRLRLILEHAITIFRLQKRYRFDVLHAHGYTAAWAAVPSKLLLRVPLVITTHGTELLWPKWVRWKSDFEVRTSRLIEALSLHFCDVIVVQSEGVKEYMLRIYGRHLAPKMKQVHTGVDHDKFNVNQKSDMEPTILFVGALSEIKGVSYLLRSFKRVLQSVPDARLILAGGGQRESEYRSYARRLGLDSRVIFLGPVNDDSKLVELYRNTDVVVLPSNVGGPVSCTVLEGLSSGRAVISTDVPGGIPDVLSNGAGVLIKPMDEDRLTEELVRLLSDRDYLESYKKKARETVVKKYTLESMIEKLEKLYTEIT